MQEKSCVYFAACYALPVPLNKYGVNWPGNPSDLSIEMTLCRAGGTITSKGRQFGLGMFHHFRAVQQLLWPEDDHHRWSNLILKEYLENRITIVAGPKDTSKTHSLARIALTDYWMFPNDTLWLISSTDLRGLELRIWGDLKDLFNRARDRYPELPGHVLESKHGIFTDEITDDDMARDIRKGCICIPCIGGNGEWVGIEKMVGIKQKRRRLLGDELQFMKAPYLISIEHLDKGDFKMAGSGNPIGQSDPLDKMAEPVGGWGTEPDSSKTEVWKNRWNGVTINLDGRDSPNNDEPKNRYPYLINDGDIARTKGRYGDDSATYWNQVIGKRKPGLNAHRVLTREMCQRFGAFKAVVWEGTTARTAVYALDAGFGGDPAVGGKIECGVELGGQSVIKVFQPDIIPIKVGQDETAEEQLAKGVKQRMNALSISPSNLFFDAGMYATLAVELARPDGWTNGSEGTDINAVNFQGKATERPVSNDDYLWDEQTHQKRLRRCDEAYSKFVTELWFSVRLVAMCRQLREMPEVCVNEFGLREWIKVGGDRYELETKVEFKERLGFSPNYADWLSIAVEGARRLGFLIERLRGIEGAEQEDDDWLAREQEKHRKFVRSSELKYQ